MSPPPVRPVNCCVSHSRNSSSCSSSSSNVDNDAGGPGDQNASMAGHLQPRSRSVVPAAAYDTPTGPLTAPHTTASTPRASDTAVAEVGLHSTHTSSPRSSCSTASSSSASTTSLSRQPTGEAKGRNSCFLHHCPNCLCCLLALIHMLSATRPPSRVLGTLACSCPTIAAVSFTFRLCLIWHLCRRCEQQGPKVSLTAESQPCPPLGKMTCLKPPYRFECGSWYRPPSCEVAHKAELACNMTGTGCTDWHAVPVVIASVCESSFSNMPWQAKPQIICQRVPAKYIPAPARPSSSACGCLHCLLATCLSVLVRSSHACLTCTPFCAAATALPYLHRLFLIASSPAVPLQSLPSPSARPRWSSYSSPLGAPHCPKMQSCTSCCLSSGLSSRTSCPTCPTAQPPAPWPYCVCSTTPSSTCHPGLRNLECSNSWTRLPSTC